MVWWVVKVHCAILSGFYGHSDARNGRLGTSRGRDRGGALSETKRWHKETKHGLRNIAFDLTFQRLHITHARAVTGTGELLATRLSDADHVLAL